MGTEFFYGVVDWFGSKGLPYGYLMRDGDRQLCYVHYKNISPENQENPKYKTLAPGMRVKYKVGTGYHSTGSQAYEVTVIEMYG